MRKRNFPGFPHVHKANKEARHAIRRCLLPAGVGQRAAKSHVSHRIVETTTPASQSEQSFVRRCGWCCSKQSLILSVVPGVGGVLHWWEGTACASLFQVNHTLESTSAVHIVFVCLTLSVGSHFVLCFFFLKCTRWCCLHRDCFLLILRLVIF